MKTKISLIVFALFLLLQLPCSSYASSPALAFNDSVTLKIDFDEYRGRKGDIFEARFSEYRYVALRIQLINNSDSKQEVNLDEIYLYDTVNKLKYQPEYVIKTNGISLDKNKYQTIKKADYVYRKIVFKVPKNFVALCVLYNNKLWAISK